MKNVLLLLTFLGIFVSCGTPKGKTAAKFNLGFAVGPFSNGGLMVFGKKEDTPGVYFSKRILSSADSVELSNGVWSFKTIAWDGLNFLEGNVKCSGAENISLNGTETDVVLNFNPEECQEGDVFGPVVSQGEVGQFNKLTLVTCNNHRAIQENDSEKIAQNCVRGGTKSFEIIIPEFNDNGVLSVSTGLKSACQDYTNTMLPTEDTNLRIPIFNDPQAPLTFFVVSYPELGCSGPAEVVNARKDYGSLFNVDYYQNKSMVTIKSEYCQGNNLSNLVTSNTFNFRGGTWHMICNATQFGSAFTSNNTLPFALGSDIDFGGADFNNTYTIGTGGELFGNGKTLSNFVHNFVGTPSTRGALFQSINGNISDLNIRDVQSDIDYNAATVGGTGVVFGGRGANAAIVLKNINLDNIHLDVRNNGGAVTGSRFGLVGGDFSSTNELKDISVTNSSITLDGGASSQIHEVGGIFGRFEGILRGAFIENFSVYSETGNNILKTQSLGSVIGKTVTQVQLSHIEVRNLNFSIDHPAQAIGGVVGSLAEATDFTGISAQGLISLTENASTHPDIGGIAGIVNHSGTFYGELLNSRVDINASNAAGGAGPVGGIFGKTSGTPSNLRMARYDGTITGKTTCGGLVGSDTSGGQIDYVFSHGTVDCAGGTVGGILADGGTTTVAHATSSMNIINGGSSGGGGLVGRLVGAGGTLDNSYFGGSLDGTNPRTAGDDGLLVGRCDGCTIQTSYTDVGDTNEVALGTGYTPGAAGCALVDNGGSNQCAGYGTYAILKSSYGDGTLTNINWTDGDGKHRLTSEKFFHRYIDVAGTKYKPFGITSINDWNLFGNLQLIEPSFKVKGSSFILLNDLDFQNTQSLFVPWKAFAGHFQGNDMGIYNVTFTETGTESLGLFRSLLDGAKIDHETPTGFKKLYLKNFNLTQNGAFSAGALAGESSFGSAGFVGVYGVEVWNSTIQSNMSTGGLIGKLSSTGTDTFEIEDIRIRGTDVVANSGSGTGGAIGNINMTSASGKTLFNILVDSQSSVTQSTTQNYIGGVVGQASNITGAALINYARIDANDYGGGVFGQMTNSTVQYIHADNDSSNCAGANCGGLVGESLTTSVIAHSTNNMFLNASAAGIFGSQTGTTFTNIISEDGNSYDLASTAQTTSMTCFSDPTAFCQSFSLASEHYFWEASQLPRLRWIEQIQKSHP